jgi:hypothetical protein
MRLAGIIVDRRWLTPQDRLLSEKVKHRIVNKLLASLSTEATGLPSYGGVTRESTAQEPGVFADFRTAKTRAGQAVA